MSVALHPYLSFADNAREAMEFYNGVFGGSLQMMTFKDFQASRGPGDDVKIMHAELDAGEVRFMAADTPHDMDRSVGTNISLSLSGEDEATLRGYFDRLQDGGTVLMPLEKAMWGGMFGMLIDRFGIRWLVNVSQGQAYTPAE
jgi:PhnB protein